MSTIRTIGGHVAGLAWVAIKSFVGTLLVLTGAGIALAAIAYYFLADSTGWSILIGVVALFEAIAAGIFFGIKRATIMTLAHGLAKLRLGRSAVQLVFNKLIGVTEDDERDVGDRGGQVAQFVERLPLAQAEKKLSEAVQAVIRAPEKSWFRRHMQGILIRLVQRVTLTAFRKEGAIAGGVDLVKVRADLEDRVDAMLVDRLRSGLNLWTIGIIIGLPLVVAVEVGLVYFFVLANK